MDAESLSVETSSTQSPARRSILSYSSRWTMSTSPSFIPDIGMISGKAFFAIGKVQIRMLKRLWVRYRRHVIDAHFRHGDNYVADDLHGMYVDLIDFSRRELYSQKIRLWALGLLRSQILKTPLHLVQVLQGTPSIISVPVLYNILQGSWLFCDHGSSEYNDGLMTSAPLTPLVAQLAAESELFAPHSEAREPLFRMMLTSLVINTTQDAALSERWVQNLKQLLRDAAFQDQEHSTHYRLMSDICRAPPMISGKLCKHVLTVLQDLITAISPRSTINAFRSQWIARHAVEARWTDFQDPMDGHFCERVLDPIGVPMHSMNDLMQCLLSQNLLPTAEILSRRTLEACIKNLGARHQFALEAALKLGHVLGLMERYEEAELLYVHALEGFGQTLFDSTKNTPTFNFAGPRRHVAHSYLVPGYVVHPRTLAALLSLADVIKRQGRFGEATPLYCRALCGSESTFGCNHQHTLRVAIGLAENFRRQKQWPESEALYRRVLQEYKRIHGVGSPKFLQALHGLGIVLLEQGRLADAEQLYRRALEIDVLSTTTVSFARNLWMLIGLVNSLRRQGRHAEAEVFVRQIKDIQSSVAAARAAKAVLDHSATAPPADGVAEWLETTVDLKPDQPTQAACNSTSEKQQIDDVDALSNPKLQISIEQEEMDGSVLLYEILAM